MINNIMLIDDDKVDVFISQRLIEKYDSNLNIRVFNNANSALSFFKLLELNTNIKSLALPDVILLDINMPEINGFKFLEEFSKLKRVNELKTAVYMLSSSLCPEDVAHAENAPYCSGYIMKPLTIEKLEIILNASAMVEHLQQFKKII